MAKQIVCASQSTVLAVAFVDESQLVAGYDNSDIRRWKIEDGQQLGPTMQTGRRVYSIAVSQDGRWIVSGDNGNKATLWNAFTSEKVRHTEHRNSVYAVDVSSDCTKVVGASYNTTDNIRLFDIASGTELLPPISHRYVVGVKFSPDGSRFATVSRDSGVRVYSTHDGKVLFDSGTRGLTNSFAVTPLAWSSDGQQLFVASKGKITSFNTSDSSSSEWPIHENKSSVSIASNGEFIACSAGSSVSLWDCMSHRRIGSIITHAAGISCIALSPSGGYLACGGSNNITAHDLRDVLPSKYFSNGLPLVQLSGQTFKSWTQGILTNTEALLSEEIKSASSSSHALLACRAILRVHLRHVALAMEDGKQSLRIRPSPIGYIAMAIALLGQADGEDALRIFDLAFHDCKLDDIRCILLLKSILVFESGNQEDAITRVELLATRADDDSDDDAIYLYMQVLAVMYMKKGNYRRALPLIERAKSLAQKDKLCPPLTTISLIFGWSFNGLDVVAQRHLCETLYAEGRTAKAVEILTNIIRTSNQDTQGSKINADWVADYIQKCVMTLEHVGDKALGSAKHEDAITQYSTALSLSPPSPTGLLIKRSKARAAKRLWEDALQDANEAVKSDPSNPWGYEAKHVALHGMERYDEAIDAFNSMLHAIEQSRNPEIRQLRKNYISPSRTIAAIDSISRKILKSCPLVVIDVITGHLCNGPERLRIFKVDPSYKEFVSSTTKELDEERIRQVVTRFFGYVMFSHAWQGQEPSFQDVSVVKSVWDLPKTGLNKKLHNFCNETRRLGYRWAWSDTCCIDKATSSILNQSLTSMYKWYADSAATLVFLSGVTHPSKPGDLARSLWMTRAWTLQELLAPKVIYFYDSEWKPYLGNTGHNHKESLGIMQELANAIKIPHGTITTFSPDDLAIWEKLRLASTRNATVEEDVAYSLIGIFKSDIRPHYGEGANALGHLLEEIVTRFGEVTVLAWSGKSSSYNSCLPASISVYNQTPYNPPLLEGEQMETYFTELRGKLSQEVALSIYKQINSLPLARFAARRLHLPCIAFSVRKLGIQELCKDNVKVYRAGVLGLGLVEFRTTEDLPLQKPQKLVFAHPWIPYIRGPSDGDTWEGDLESVVEFGLDLEHDAGSDEAVPPSPLHAVSPPQVDKYTQALQLIARLGQPFNALLLVQQVDRHYRRVATENEIVVPGLGTDVSSQNIRTAVLEIL